MGETKKILVVYYSKTGNNKYLAERLANNLGCDIEAIMPKTSSYSILLLTTLLKLGVRVNMPKYAPSDYDVIIICGPIWMGQLVSPIKSFIKKYRESIHTIYFVTSCGSSDAMRAKTFGYGKVFQKVEKLLKGKNLYCEAFPIPLIVPEDKLDDGETVMNTRLSDENFKGEMLKRFEYFIKKVNSK